jgi:2-methylaconitate cis-trans-isomerase PrpF
MDLTGIPALFMRGGTSSGPYWNARDLPADPARRDAVLLAALGTTDGLSDEVDSAQLGGVGGATPVTSKTAILSASPESGVDIDYLFAQVDLKRPFVDTNPSCGNILSAVGHAALEMGLVEAADPVTRIVIRNTNTGSLMEAVLETPGGRWSYLGSARIDGVAGSAAPVMMNFLDVVGSKTGSMFPTGQRMEEINGLTVSLIDVAVPMIWFRAAELGLAGNETKAELDDAALIARMEAARLIASERMGLGDARGKVVPKMGIASAPRHGGSITSRYFVPQDCHPTHAVTGSINVATAATQPGTVVAEAAAAEPLRSQSVVIEHPAGTITVELAYKDGASGPVFDRAGVVRTAKKIMAGEIFVPAVLLDD